MNTNIIVVYFNSVANEVNSAEAGYSDEVVEDCPLLSLSNDISAESSLTSTPPYDIFLRPSFRENQEILNTSTLNTTIQLDNVIDSLTTESSTKSSSVLSNFFINPIKNKPVSSNIMNFCDKMNENEQKNIDILLARSIYASSSPLNLVENAYWKEFFKKIRPAYCPPSTYIISHRLLDDEYKRVKECTNNNILNASVLGIMCDGWTNLRNESIVNFVVTTPNPIFFKSISTGTDRHTGEKMAEEIINVIEEIGQTKVFGIVTDNAKNMKKAWQLITDKYPLITAYGCVAHGLNLLVNDIMNLKLFNDVINEGKSIVNNIRRGHITNALFLQKRKNIKNSTALTLPVVTRWASVVVFLNSLLVNKQIIRSMSIDETIEKDLKPEVKKLISSADFWDKIYYFHQLVSPLAKWIKIIESDLPKLSSVPFIFKELETSFKNTIHNCIYLKTEEKNIMKTLKIRKEFCISSIHNAAHLLDPKYFGKCLNPEEHSDAVEFIYQLSKKLDCLEVDARQVITDIGNFKNKTGPFSKEYLWVAINDTNGLNWWNAFCSETEVSKIAIKILSLPATSAAVERTFSSYKDVHSLKRNRLTNERASKLVFIKHNLKVIYYIIY